MLTNREQRLLTIGLWLALMLNVGIAVCLIVDGSPAYIANLSAIVCLVAALRLRRWARQRDGVTES